MTTALGNGVVLLRSLAAVLFHVLIYVILFPLVKHLAVWETTWHNGGALCFWRWLFLITLTVLVWRVFFYN